MDQETSHQTVQHGMEDIIRLRRRMVVDNHSKILVISRKDIKDVSTEVAKLIPPRQLNLGHLQDVEQVPHHR